MKIKQIRKETYNIEDVSITQLMLLLNVLKQTDISKVCKNKDDVKKLNRISNVIESIFTN